MKKILIILIITILVIFTFMFFRKNKKEDGYLKIENINKIVLDNLSKIKVIESKKATKIPVLNYHFFYNPDLGEKCRETICLDVKKLEEHIKYLKENNYKILTITEYVTYSLP